MPNLRLRKENLKSFLHPKSIAVIGASRHPKKVGWLILDNLIKSGFPGKIFPVNPYAQSILGKKVFSSIQKIPQKVDLAIIALPAPLVPAILEETGQKGTKAAIIIAAGFGEEGKEGKKRSQILEKISQKYSLRFLGPNCLGIIRPQSKLNASWAAATPTSGPLAFISQSGAIFSPAYNFFKENGIGLSLFVSLGNKKNINENDWLLFLANDPQTKVIAAYLESFKEGQSFLRLAQKITPKKPIILLKGGLTPAGTRAAQSHTASLATPRAVIKGAMKQARIIMAEDLRTFFQLIRAAVFIQEKKKKIATDTTIITNAGGLGVLAADALDQAPSLSLARLNAAVRGALRRQFPHLNISSQNQSLLDILGNASAEKFQKALKIIRQNYPNNNIFIIATQQRGTPLKKIKEAINQEAKKSSALVITNIPLKNKKKENSFLNFDFPKEAINTLNKIKENTQSAKKKKKIFPSLPLSFYKQKKIQQIIKDSLRQGKRQLSYWQTQQILSFYQISTPPAIAVSNFSQAQQAAQKIGYPLFLKIASSKIIHKTDIGGVAKITHPEELKKAFLQMQESMKLNRIPHEGFILEKEIQGETEIIIGAKKDPSFGQIIMIGGGGIYTEFLSDSVFRVAPINNDDAQEMIKELKIYPLLKGVRGGRGVSIRKIEKYLLAISHLITTFPQINQLDINPLIGQENSLVAVDTKIILTTNDEK